MARPRGHRLPATTDVEQVLRGQRRLGLRELLDLVRRVNPSRIACSAATREERYVLKARLQSLILREYGHEILVRPTTRAGVVGLRRRVGRGDAGHAVLARLDPDARAIVEALMQGAGSASPPER